MATSPCRACRAATSLSLCSGLVRAKTSTSPAACCSCCSSMGVQVLAGEHLVGVPQPKLSGDGSGGQGVVAGDHFYPDTGTVAFLDSPDGVGPAGPPHPAVQPLLQLFHNQLTAAGCHEPRRPAQAFAIGTGQIKTGAEAPVNDPNTGDTWLSADKDRASPQVPQDHRTHAGGHQDHQCDRQQSATVHHSTLFLDAHHNGQTVIH